MFTMLGVFPLGLLLHNKIRGQIIFTTPEKRLSGGILVVAGVFAIMASNGCHMDQSTYLALVILSIGCFVIYVGSILYGLLPSWMTESTDKENPPTKMFFPEVPQWQNADEQLLGEQSPESEYDSDPFFRDYGAMTGRATDSASAAEAEPQSPNGSHGTISEASSATISSDSSTTTTPSMIAAMSPGLTAATADSSTPTSPDLTAATQPQSEVRQADATHAGPKPAPVSGWCLALSYLAIVVFTTGASISLTTILSKYQLRHNTITEMLFSSIHLLPVLVVTCVAAYRGVGTVITNLALNVLYLSLTLLFYVLPLPPKDESLPRPRGMQPLQSVAVVIAGLVFMLTLCLQQWQRFMAFLLLSYGMVFQVYVVYKYVGGGLADDY
jgi:hypothetical protein